MAVLLEDELPEAAEQNTVDLWRVRRVHWHVEYRLDERFDSRAVDADFIERSRRPAVGPRGRRPVCVAFRIPAAGIELALVVVAAEVVRAATIREREGDH